MDEFWLWQNSRNGYDVFDAIQGQPTPEQAYAARVQVVFSGVEAANNTLQVWVPTKFTQKGDLIQITLGHNETVNLCFGGDILCDDREMWCGSSHRSSPTTWSMQGELR